jgi:hypothetical protein
MLFHILAKLSERFGSVLKMQPIHKWFYVAEGFATIAMVAHFIQASSFLSASNQELKTTSLLFTLILHHVPLAIAVTIGLVVTWKYWGWLVTERRE